jgi:hypothetical protein
VIHFFGKVYLSYAETSVGAEAMDRTSEYFIQIVDKGFVHMENLVHVKKRIYYTQDVRSFLENFSCHDDFFKGVLKVIQEGHSKKVMMYVDEHAMLELLIRWWKALFPQITAKGIYALYVNYGDNQIIQDFQKLNYIDLTGNSAKINLSKFSDLYWGSSFEKIQGLFELYPAFEISDEIKSYCGIEYKIMNFLSEDKPRYLPGLIETVKDLYTKKVMDEFTGIKRMIERSLFQMHDYFESEQLMLKGQSIRPALLKQETLKFILDEKFQNSKSSYEYLVSHYDLPKLAQALIEVDRYLVLKSHDSSEATSLDNPCLTNICENGGVVDYIDILKKEISGRSNLQLFKRMIQNKRMNAYLAIAFNNLLANKDENAELIAEFSFGVA